MLTEDAFKKLVSIQLLAAIGHLISPKCDLGILSNWGQDVVPAGFDASPELTPDEEDKNNSIDMEIQKHTQHMTPEQAEDFRDSPEGRKFHIAQTKIWEKAEKRKHEKLLPELKKFQDALLKMMPCNIEHQWAVFQALGVQSFVQYISTQTAQVGVVQMIYGDELLACKTHAEVAETIQRRFAELNGVKITDEIMTALNTFAPVLLTYQMDVGQHVSRLLMNDKDAS